MSQKWNPEVDGDVKQLVYLVECSWSHQWPGWPWVAKSLSEEYPGAPRTASACRSKYEAIVAIRSQCEVEAHVFDRATARAGRGASEDAIIWAAYCLGREDRIQGLIDTLTAKSKECRLEAKDWGERDSAYSSQYASQADGKSEAYAESARLLAFAITDEAARLLAIAQGGDE